MTHNDRTRELASVARQFGTLFNKLSSVMQDWANEIETTQYRNTAASSPLSNHSAEPPPNLTQPSLGHHHHHHHHSSSLAAAAAVVGGDHSNSVISLRKAMHHHPSASAMMPSSMAPSSPGAITVGHHLNAGITNTGPTGLSIGQQPSSLPHHFQPPVQTHPPHPYPSHSHMHPLSHNTVHLLKKRRDDSDRSLEDGTRPKRTRVDWTEKENVVLFSTLEKYSHLSENDLLQEIVKALGGTRTIFQSRGRFRNLLANGRIRASDTLPKRWIVVPGRSGRRVRVNWSDEEDQALFETVRAFKHFEEDELLQEIVKALKGSRTWFQAKGHFRNLLTSGKIRASDTIPHHWVVVDDSELLPPENDTPHIDNKDARVNSNSNHDDDEQQPPPAPDDDDGDHHVHPDHHHDDDPHPHVDHGQHGHPNRTHAHAGHTHAGHTDHDNPNLRGGF